jgi:hypothetical protein
MGPRASLDAVEKKNSRIGRQTVAIQTIAILVHVSE